MDNSGENSTARKELSGRTNLKQRPDQGRDILRHLLGGFSVWRLRPATCGAIDRPGDSRCKRLRVNARRKLQFVSTLKKNSPNTGNDGALERHFAETDGIAGSVAKSWWLREDGLSTSGADHVRI